MYMNVDGLPANPWRRYWKLEGKYSQPPGPDPSQALQLLVEHLSQTAEMATHLGHPTISEDEFRGKLNV